VLGFAVAFGSLLALTTLAFIFIESRHDKKRFAWALVDEPISKTVPLIALFTPIVPIALMLPFTLNWPIIPAFLVGIIWGLVTTEPARLIPNLTACILEGLKDVSPVIGLFIGIGMTLNAMMDPTTSAIMAPFITAVLPHSTVAYIAFFTLLAPLSLYRGPFNAFGLGAGFASLVMASGQLPPAAVMSAFLVVGQMQGICDPTNTHNVWIAQFTHGSTEDYLKRTLPYVWGFILIALIYAVAVRGVMHP